MKKFIISVLCLLCLACLSLALFGCGSEGNKDDSSNQETAEHIHKYVDSVVEPTCMEDGYTLHRCSCGNEYKDNTTSALGHSFTNYKSNKDATCTQDGTKTAKCDRCDVTDTVTDTNSKLAHTFDKKVATETYLVSSATCTQKAVYYYSCVCGEKGTQTFEYGNTLGHSFTNYVSDNNATCTQDGTKTAKCDRCEETKTITDSNTKLGHSFTNYVSDNNATYEKDGTKTAHCNHNGCTATDTVTDTGSMLESSMSFKTLTVDGTSVYGKVSNKTESFSFINEVETVGLTKFVVALDIYGSQQVATKTIALKVGDNKVYVIEMLDGEPQTVYEVTVRRREIYTVTFDTQSGTAVDSQNVEEDSLVVEPSTTKTGYTFDGWDYDLRKPITSNTKITAKWLANTDTKYTVEYYLENLEDSNYTLHETDNLQGTTDTTATANIKTYEHFTFNSSKSIVSGNIACDGSLVLKVYYTRNTYSVSTTAITTSGGTYTPQISSAKSYYKYEYKINFESTTNLGYKFGWYSGDKLLSSAASYIHTVESNIIITAKWTVADEMQNFKFTSTITTCTISSVIDESITSLFIPSCVTSIAAKIFTTSNNVESISVASDNATYYSENNCYY